MFERIKNWIRRWFPPTSKAFLSQTQWLGQQIQDLEKQIQDFQDQQRIEFSNLEAHILQNQEQIQNEQVKVMQQQIHILQAENRKQVDKLKDIFVTEQKEIREAIYREKEELQQEVQILQKNMQTKIQSAQEETRKQFAQIQDVYLDKQEELKEEFEREIRLVQTIVQEAQQEIQLAQKDNKQQIDKQAEAFRSRQEELREKADREKEEIRQEIQLVQKTAQETQQEIQLVQKTVQEAQQEVQLVQKTVQEAQREVQLSQEENRRQIDNQTDVFMHKQEELKEGTQRVKEEIQQEVQILQKDIQQEIQELQKVIQKETQEVQRETEQQFNRKIDVLISKQEEIKEEVHKEKQNIQQEIQLMQENVQQETCEQLETSIADLQSEIFKEIRIRREIKPKLVYRNLTEREALAGSFAEIMQNEPVFEEKLLSLLRGLDESSRSNVMKILSRMEKILDGNTKGIDLFSDKEKAELMKMKEDFNEQIIRISDSLYCYDGYLLPVNQFDASVFYSRYGIENVRTLRKVAQGDIIDVGGYVGDTALLLSPMTTKQVYVFEASPDNCSLIEKTISLNHLSNVQLENVALGDKRTVMSFSLGERNSCNTLVERPGYTYLSQIETQVIPLDDYVNEHNLQVSLIKLDVEGAEQLVLKGAIETIRKYKPVLLISIYHTASDFFDIKPMIEELDLGYKFTVFKPTNSAIVMETILIAEV